MKQKLFTKAIENACRKVKPYSQEGMDMDAKVIARFFGGSSYTCYILEPSNDPDIFFGLVNIGYGFEYGYISRKQLESLRFKPFGLPLERDICVDPLKRRSANALLNTANRWNIKGKGGNQKKRLPPFLKIKSF